MSDLVKQLNMSAAKIYSEGINGWGNVMEDAARHIEKLETENKRMKEEKACFKKEFDYALSTLP